MNRYLYVLLAPFDEGYDEEVVKVSWKIEEIYQKCGEIALIDRYPIDNYKIIKIEAKDFMEG